MVRVSARAHKLAALQDSEGNRGRGIEFALELALVMQVWERDPLAAVTLERTDVGPGPLSGEAYTRFSALRDKIVNGILERAVREGIESYRAQEFFKKRASEEAAE